MVTYQKADSNIWFITLGSYSGILIPFRICAIICASFGMLLGEAILPDSLIFGGQTSRAKSHTLMYFSPDLDASPLPNVAFPTPGVPVSRMFGSKMVLAPLALDAFAHGLYTRLIFNLFYPSSNSPSLSLGGIKPPCWDLVFIIIFFNSATFYSVSFKKFQVTFLWFPVPCYNFQIVFLAYWIYYT